MKKLALVLGSLLVVGTAATAKEVMPAPVMVPEKVVEVVEKPVIVYRDREVAPAWRPNGSVDVQYRWYGNTENKEKGNDGKEGKKASWANKNDDYGRLQIVTNVNFTEKQTLNIRTRTYNGLKSENRSHNEKTDQIRLRHFYDFGTVADTKITAKSRLEYTQDLGDGEKAAEASVAFDFANYFFSNDYFKVDTFALRPLYSHTWANHGDDDSFNRYGLSLETAYTLPFGFGLEFNIHGRHDRKLKNNRYKYDLSPEKKTKSDTWAEIELILSNSVNLYKTGNFAVNFNFEGGYDTYDVHKKKMVYSADKTGAYRSKYSLYALPTLELTYKPTDFVKLYAAAGAEYRNWNYTAQSEARNWRWQPTAWAGMKVTF
ncbi:major outer membrane protein FomA [Fusobacterium russii]|uniref:major outer membrane protein FomA n=1 Tax=Fusobacterium russii TaxID=854 RepID=UPI0003B467B6|nr:hypothetical protein [Fusobacterium russii]